MDAFWCALVLSLSFYSLPVDSLDCIICQSKAEDDSCAKNVAPADAKTCPGAETHCFVEHDVTKSEYTRGCTDKADLCGTRTKEQCDVCSAGDKEKSCVPVLAVATASGAGDGEKKSPGEDRQKPSHKDGEFIWCIQCNLWSKSKRDDLSCAKKTDVSAATPCMYSSSTQCAVWFEPTTGFYQRGCVDDRDLCKGFDNKTCAVCKPSGPGKDLTCAPKLNSEPTPPPSGKRGIDCIQCESSGRNSSKTCALDSDISHATPCDLIALTHCFIKQNQGETFERGCTMEEDMCKKDKLTEATCVLCSPKAGEFSCVPQLNPLPSFTTTSTIAMNVSAPEYTPSTVIMRVEGPSGCARTSQLSLVTMLTLISLCMFLRK